MPTVSKLQRLRFQLDSASESDLSDIISSGTTPHIWRAVETNIEFALYQGGVIVDSLANIASITCEVRRATRLKSVPAPSKTILVGALAACAANVWLDGSNQFGIFKFTKGEMALPLDDESTTQTYVFTFTVYFTDGTDAIVGKAVVSVEEGGRGVDYPDVTGGGVSGIAAIAQDAETVTVASLNLSFVPSGGWAHVMKPAGGMSIQANIVTLSLSSAGFTVELTGKPDSNAYVLSYTLFP